MYLFVQFLTCEARPGLSGALFLFRCLSVVEGNEIEKSGNGGRNWRPNNSTTHRCQLLLYLFRYLPSGSSFC